MDAAHSIAWFGVRPGRRAAAPGPTGNRLRRAGTLLRSKLLRSIPARRARRKGLPRGGRGARRTTPLSSRGR